MATLTAESSLVEQIGLTAGEVWHLLAEEGSLPITQIARKIDAPRDRVMLGLGWLAREGKIEIEGSARSKVVSLRIEE